MVPVFPASGHSGYRIAVTRALRPAPPRYVTVLVSAYATEVLTAVPPGRRQGNLSLLSG